MADQKRSPGDHPATHPLRIAVKLNERASAERTELAEVGKLLEEYLGRAVGTLPLLPLIESVDPTRLNEMTDRAMRADRGLELSPPDFSRWRQVVTPADVNPDELANALRQLDIVETAYVMRPGPPPVNPGNDPRYPNEGYLSAAPNGIDATYAWGFTGGDGAGIGFVDMEQGWNLNHEDLAAAGITLISGINNAYFFHGTSVLGEVRMVDNGVGGVGIAPQSNCRVVSQWRTAASYNTADAILNAVSVMAFGDVLLLEAQEYDPVGGAYLWPVEIVDGTYDAIRLATALGIVVVEAGCNGSYDLDAYKNLSGKKIFDRSSPDFRDSGAIMVGAGSSAAPHSRLSFSNFGSRIDCYAWGENVDTTTTNSTGTDNTAYTGSFNGTSSASPIVSGAAVVSQGLAQAGLGYRFSPRELRNILTSNGTASANPTIDKIGVMPDLRAIITGNHLNLAPDLYLRDYVGDTGSPTNGMVSQSPDIIVKQAAVPNPQATYGAGSGTENNDALSDDVDTGHDNFIYVRLLDRGGAAATNVSVDLYWSPPSTLVTPSMWNAIGSVAVPSVPSGNVLTVSDAITWPAAAIPYGRSLLLCGGGRRCAGPQAGPHELPHVRRIRDIHRKQQQRRVAELQCRGGSALGRIASGLLSPALRRRGRFRHQPHVRARDNCAATRGQPRDDRDPGLAGRCAASAPLRGQGRREKPRSEDSFQSIRPTPPRDRGAPREKFGRLPTLGEDPRDRAEAARI